VYTYRDTNISILLEARDRSTMYQEIAERIRGHSSQDRQHVRSYHDGNLRADYIHGLYAARVL